MGNELMNRYEVRLHAETDEGDAESAREILDHLDNVADQLELIETNDPQIVEFDVSAHLADRTVEVSVIVEAEGRLDALDLGGSAIRAAIHAAGGATPDWEALIRTQNLAIVSAAEDCVPA